MASDTVEFVLAALRRFEAEDFEAGTWHPDAVLTAPAGWPEPGPFEGRDAIIAQLRRLASEMGEHRFTNVEVLAERDGWVVLSLIWEVQGAGSGAGVASKMAVAYHLSDGMFEQAHFRWTPEDALEAAGLAE